MRKLLCNTVATVILVILAMASIAVTVLINVNASSKQSLLNSTTRDKTTDSVNASTTLSNSSSNNTVTRESQEHELNTLLFNLETISNPNKAITDIIDRFVEVRYNYTGGPDKEKILSDLSGITRKYYLGQVDNSLNYITGDSKAIVIKRYVSKYDNAVTSVADNTIDSYVYIVNINGENKVLEYTMFKDSGKWVVYNEREIGSISDKEIQTKELLTPDVVKTTSIDKTETEGNISER